MLLDTTLSSAFLKDNGPSNSFITQEWVVLGPNKYTVVSEPGDSGGLLVNNRDQAVAMVIGGIHRPLKGESDKTIDNITVVTRQQPF